MTLFRTESAIRIKGRPSERGTGLLIVAGLHGALLYALFHMLGFVPIPSLPMPIIGTVIPGAERPDDPPPQRVDVVLPPLTPYIPPIIDVVTVEAQPAPGALSLLAEQVARPRPVLPPPAAPTITPARSIAATHTIPDYPALSIRLVEQGTVVLQLAITPTGQVGGAAVKTSSGHTRLDEAAMAWVKAHWRYEPALQDGKPIASTASASVTFKLD